MSGTDEMNHKIELVNSINDVLPYGSKIKIPSLITNNYIDRKLYSLEERLPQPATSQIPIKRRLQSYSKTF
jgi:hypothetical protein